MARVAFPLTFLLASLSAVATAQTPAIVDGPSAPALVQAMDRTAVASELAARISEMPVRPGERFAEGDVLVRFACAAYEAQRAVARADVASAQAQLAVKKRLFELQSAGALEVDVAAAAVARAQAEVRLYQVQVDRCILRAPYAGRVVEWTARPFGSVEAGEPLLEIVGVERLEVEVIVPVAWMRWLKPGARFQLAAADGAQTAQATVKSLGAAVDPASQTVVIRGALEEPGPGWLPGLSGRAVFAAPDQDG
ncbi:MAG: efflux RND transporter periplasmic adaptor subunit [Marivibrio sp.]|uniref:efflux RND transporter periplasmic adaptor subunit n=1 Tax=Marivibrio sp. TaxID=2039719 RepID=UPI0032EE2D32